MQDNLKNLRIITIQQVHPKVTSETILVILLNLFSIYTTFESRANWIFK